MTPPSGVLLHGQPGTDKRLATAVANATEASFVSVKGPKLLEHGAGGAIAAVQDLFERARENTPCVIVVDEVDALVRPGRFETSVLVGLPDEGARQETSRFTPETSRSPTTSTSRRSRQTEGYSGADSRLFAVTPRCMPSGACSDRGRQCGTGYHRRRGPYEAALTAVEAIAPPTEGAVAKGADFSAVFA